jgi:uncharacterized membrane protein
LLVKWKAPGMPNGIVTGYFLYKDGVEVYSGGGYSFNITGLQVHDITNMLETKSSAYNIAKIHYHHQLSTHCETICLQWISMIIMIIKVSLAIVYI